MGDNKAVVLFSGGQDSTTCLYWAKERFDKVYAVCFSYNQKHSAEIDVARKLANQAKVDFQLLDASFISSLSKNALTDASIKMDEDNNCPNTFVPGRNLFFLSIAAVYAYEHQIKNIITGVSEADYSGYPDCRLNFIESATKTINLAMDQEFIIHTPLMNLDKSEVWALSDKLGVFDLIREETLTCYNGLIGKGCGHCPACKLRNNGLANYLTLKKGI